MAALRSKKGNDCSLHIDEGARFQADYTIIADRDTGVHADSRFATFISRILRSAAHRLRGSLCFAALWYANSFIHGKQTCAAPTKLLEPRVTCKTNEEGCANSVKSLQRLSQVLPISRSHG
jgi:hypothetical protein